MRCRGIGGLALALGLLVPAARADDGWQPSAANAGASLGRPEPAASLDPPVPLQDPVLRPVSFDLPGALTPTIRASGPDASLARPEPLAVTSANSGAMFQWRRAPEAAPMGDSGSGVIAVVNTGPPPLAGTEVDSAVLHPTADEKEPILTMPTPGPADARPVPAWPMVEPNVTDGDLCGAAVNECCGGCCPPGNRWYGSADALMWWIRGQPLPPLVTTSTLPFTPNSGALGVPGTVVEYGGNSVNSSLYWGGRLTLGWWVDPEHDLGIEASGFFLGSRTSNFQTFSNAQTLLARPFFNVDTGLQDREITSAPGVVAGGVSINSHTSLWGAEANLRSNLICGDCGFIDVLAGFRTLGLNERLNIVENVNIVAGPFNGVGFNLLDQFRTNNQFYGGQIGAVGEWRLGRWSFDLTTKLGLGTTQQMVNIYGASVINNQGTISTFPGSGILAQSSNDGVHTRDVFTVVPEVGLSVGYQLTEHWRFSAGYNFLYWSSVVRPGNQIDLGLDPNQFATSNGALANATRPAFNFNGSDFWAQGITLSLEFKY
jgi:hypothetical protein